MDRFLCRLLFVSSPLVTCFLLLSHRVGTVTKKGDLDKFDTTPKQVANGMWKRLVAHERVGNFGDSSLNFKPHSLVHSVTRMVSKGRSQRPNAVAPEPVAESQDNPAAAESQDNGVTEPPVKMAEPSMAQDI